VCASAAGCRGSMQWPTPLRLLLPLHALP
jgi:hypothetical protein